MYIFNVSPNERLQIISMVNIVVTYMLYIYIYIYVYTYKYIYICICIYKYIYIYITSFTRRGCYRRLWSLRIRNTVGAMLIYQANCCSSANAPTRKCQTPLQLLTKHFILLCITNFDKDVISEFFTQLIKDISELTRITFSSNLLFSNAL